MKEANHDAVTIECHNKHGNSRARFVLEIVLLFAGIIMLLVLAISFHVPIDSRGTWPLPGGLK